MIEELIESDNNVYTMWIKTPKPTITTRERVTQAQKLRYTIDILEVAVKESETATPDEITQTIDSALSNLHHINEFLITRQ